MERDKVAKSNYNSAEWVEGYSDAQRTFLVDNQTNTIARLKRMGITDLPREARLLDFGCGDGNLMAFLHQQGFADVVGMEPDNLLVRTAVKTGPTVLAGGPLLPFADDSFDAVISMAVLHHLPDAAALQVVVEEFARVLRPGGLLGYCEPAKTLARSLLTPLLVGPLGKLTRFSRQKRLMVLDEWDTLNAWLDLERSFPGDVVAAAGFTVEAVERDAIKVYLRARLAA